uniref:BZIP domain-containing protein n=2 Tax=Panagrolaimus sp. JU765 TaxID=591449 RepID=A0AC34RIR1_9BILA
MNSPGSSEIDEKKSAENSESFLLNGCVDQLRVALGTPPILTTFFLNRERSNTYFKKKNWQLNTTYLYLALILGQHFFPIPTIISSDPKFKSNMYANQVIEEDQSFMAGKFPASPNNDFFNPRFRWRNDAELASYAWSNYGKFQEPQVNMLMTESRIAMPNRLGGCSSDGSGSGSCSVTSRDPSLLDYDMIDVSWRYDIEREKNMAPELNYRNTHQNMYDEQYERDLQVLHDKGFMTTLTSEESNRYEELAKAQYADFYHTVARPDKVSAGCTLTDISNSRPSCSFDKPAMSGFVENKLQSTARPTFDNITMAYMPEEQPSAFVPNHYNEDEQISATIMIAEDDYLEYFNSTQVIQDLSTAAVEQGQDSFEAVFHKIVDGRQDANIDTEFSPFDEPLPFLIDDTFFDGPEFVDSSKSLQLNTQTKERSVSPSSGFVSGSERSCSPEAGSFNDYRLHGKLIPDTRDVDDDESGDKFQRRRGRQSKDNDLVKKYNLPATAEELAGMSHKALQRLLKDPTLNESQKSLIKKIRRRGRNKEAARKCRERRVTTTPDSSSRFVCYSCQMLLASCAFNYLFLTSVISFFYIELEYD